MNSIHPKERIRIADDMLLNICGELLEQVAALEEQVKFLTYEVVFLKTIELAGQKRTTSSQRYVNKKMRELDDSFKGLLKWWHEQRPKGKRNEPYKYQ